MREAPITKRPRAKTISNQGFTLSELMVAMTLGVMVIGVGLATTLALAKGSAHLAGYSEMNNSSHRSLEMFSRDMRMATDVNSATATSISISRINPGGGPAIVQYSYNPAAKTVFRTVNAGSPSVFLTEVDSLEFRYFTLRQDLTTNPLEIKEVQIDAVLERNILTQRITNHIISARVMMRNRPVAN